MHYGLLTAQIFFGLWLVWWTFLRRSSPPDLGQNIHTFIVIPCAIAEIWMVGYLLMIGVRTDESVRPQERILAEA